MKTTIEYTSVLKDFKDIEERNYAFNNLDAQSQRLEIAWDALQLVLKESIAPAFCDYWNYELRYNLSFLNSKQTQNYLLNKLTTQCSVCARGLMLVSQIRLGNELSMLEHGSSLGEGNEETIKGFSMESFENMEEEYEREEFRHPYDRRTSEKLANMCCNILINGDFNINDDTNYLIN